MGNLSDLGLELLLLGGVSGHLQCTCRILLTALIVWSDLNSSFSGFVLLLLIGSLSGSHTLHMT